MLPTLLVLGLVWATTAYADGDVSARAFTPNEFRALYELMVQYKHGLAANCPAVIKYDVHPTEEDNELIVSHQDMKIGTNDNLENCTDAGKQRLILSENLVGTARQNFLNSIAGNLDKTAVFASLESELTGSKYYVSIDETPRICGTRWFSNGETFFYFDESTTTSLTIVAKITGAEPKFLSLPLVGNIRYMVVVSTGTTCIYRVQSDVTGLIQGTPRPSDSPSSSPLPVPSVSPSPSVTPSTSHTPEPSQTPTTSPAQPTTSSSPSRTASTSPDATDTPQSSPSSSVLPVSTTPLPSTTPTNTPPVSATPSISTSEIPGSRVPSPTKTPTPVPSSSAESARASASATVTPSPSKSGSSEVRGSPSPSSKFVSLTSATPSSTPGANKVNLGSVSPSSTPSPSPIFSDSTVPGNQLGNDRNESFAVDGTSTCFPSAATVLLDNGKVILMKDLQIGDRVEVGPREFSEVILFTHANRMIWSQFVRLTTAGGHSVSLSPGHYLYVNGKLLPARQVNIGDTVEVKGNGLVTEVKVGIQRGLFNPQTVSGDIVVDGVKASCYTETIIPIAAHSLLSPVRLVRRAAPAWVLRTFGERIEAMADRLK